MTLPRQWQIGAAPDADCWVNAPEVSSRHCLLTIGSQIIIDDRGSTNGTFVNGDRITAPTSITPHTPVTLGRSLILPWPDEIGARRVVRFGQASSNDYRIDRPGVSGQHGRLIVGPSGSLVVEDLQSTNGIAIRRHGTTDVSKRITRSAWVTENDVIFLGSTSINVSTLLSTMAASAPVISRRQEGAADQQRVATSVVDTVGEPRQRNDSPPMLPKLSSENVKTGVPVPILIVGSIGFLTLLFLFAASTWLMGVRSQQASNVAKTDEPVASIATSSGSDFPKESMIEVPDSEPDLKTAQPVPAETPNENVATALETPHPAPSTLVDSSFPSPQHASLFWLAVQSEDRLSSYRVGSAWANVQSQLVTSGSVISAIRALAAKDYPHRVAIHLKTGRHYSIVDMQVHDQLESQKSKASDSIDAYNRALADKQEPGKSAKNAQEAAQQRRQQLTRLADEMLRWQTAFVAYDIGRVVVEPGLEADIARLRLAQSARLRPGQKLRLVTCPIDLLDPFYDAELPIQGDEFAFRVVAFPQSDGATARLILQTDDRVESNNFFGSPLVDSRGRVVSIFSMASPTGNSTSSDEQLIRIEGPVASTMFQWLQQQ